MRPKQEIAKARLREAIADITRSENPNYVPALPATNETAALELFRQLAEFLTEWLSDSTKSSSGEPCAFVQVRSIQPYKNLGAAIHRLAARTNIEVGRKVFLCGENLAVTIAIDAPTDDGEDSYDAICELLDSKELSELPHAIFTPNNGKFVLFPDGAKGTHIPLDIKSIMNGDTRLTLEALEHEIDAFHEQFTKFPSGSATPWDNVKEGVLRSQMEISITRLLVVYLSYGRPGDVIFSELHLPIGRPDILIQSSAMHEGIGACVLELKVLRGRRYSSSGRKFVSISDKRNLRWAKSGIIQVMNYARIMKAGCAYLICFDARKNDGELPGLEQLAEHNNVRQMNLRMYTSTKAEREAVLEDESGE